MKIYSIILFLFLFLFLIVSCKENDAKKKELTPKEETSIQDSLNTKKSTLLTTEKTTIQDSLNTEKNMLLTKEEAIKKFGNPITQEKRLLDDMVVGLGVETYYLYTEEERQSNSIYIEECTWEKDKENNITIWYELNNERKIPKAYYIWPKGFEF